MLNEEGAKLLSDNGFKVLKYHNANPFELGGDAYMITDPSIIEIIENTPNLKPLLYPGVNSTFYEYNKNIKGYKNGKSPISIKPSKRGSFTAAAKAHGASVAEFERRVLKNPEKYSKAMRKKAQFSHNARSWKH